MRSFEVGAADTAGASDVTAGAAAETAGAAAAADTAGASDVTAGAAAESAGVADRLTGLLEQPPIPLERPARL